MSTLGILSKEITQKLSSLTLPPDAAGRRATTKVPLVTPNLTIKDVQTLLFDHAKDFETINYIYIVSEKGRLHGVISIKDVFKHPQETQIKNIEMQQLVKVHPQADQEKAAHMALKAGIKAIPLVDDKGYFLGVLPSDQIQTILDTETKEDLYRLAGIVGKQYVENTENLPVATAFIRRVPWILVGLTGGLLTASIIGNFEDVLQDNLILAGFIPLVAYVANAVGVQTQTVYIRDLATRSNIGFVGYSLKQIVTSTLIAFACWAFLLGLAGFIWESTHLGLIVGAAVFAAILVATFFALFIPYTLTRLKIDPAIGSGPFSTIVQDLLSIIIYFSVAEALL